jgi:hypothetical protein
LTGATGGAPSSGILKVKSFKRFWDQELNVFGIKNIKGPKQDR